MNGPRIPAAFEFPHARRKRELQALRKMADTKATHWHWRYMDCILGPEQDYAGAQYAQGMADAYSEIFHALSVMRGFPW